MSSLDSSSVEKIGNGSLKHIASDLDSGIVSGDGLDRTSPFAKRTWRKMDMWILPVVSSFYLLSFLDRTNLGNARVAGLQKDLGLTNHQYSVALTVTYVPYIVSELPSNLLMKIVGPHWLLPTLLTCWGITTTLQGLVKNYAGLLACRFFIGFFEGGVTPGLVLYLSAFYPRHMLQLRVSAFFSASALAGAFSGLLAAGLMKLDGKAGLRGWAWIFILEGLFTVVCGAGFFFMLPNSPAHARFLTPEQKTFVQSQLKADGAISKNSADDEFSWKEVFVAFKQPHVIILTLAYFMHGTVLFSLAYFTPTIVQGLGYKPIDAQLLSVPPFALGFIVSMSAAAIADKYSCRGYTAIFSSVLAIVGTGMLLGSQIPRIKYVSLFFSIAGIYTLPAAFGTWSANNSAPHIRRATAIAIGFMFVNSGGILSTWLLGTISLGPKYTVGASVLLAFSIGLLLASIIELLYLRRANQKKAVIRATTLRSQEKPGLGDKSAWFIYSL